MRWTDLFDDLEAQLAAQEAAQVQGEVAEHTRAALGRVSLSERFLADLGARVRLSLRGGLVVEGALSEVASDWLVLQEDGAARPRELLIVTATVLSVSGLSGRSDAGRPSRVQRSLDLRQALRALSRDRALVRAHDLDGGLALGTIDRVGADHLDLSRHPDDLPRRDRDVFSVVSIPYQALVCVARS
ncbi:hypothetical protein [Ornithinimicrobium cryptoxanthini]|uniref:Uncharacterized protein n=1 Tax=Ornithinimicrobium cryptoxanthini TaxID=2934161 RepID=A0ABY4YEU2_9MICO|nr:hypothetical protein [Ornithinimicrobium cryptoxanthini]USQ75277.1 hypothetical protein NF557_11660 [Ornithinimicrobium cryptoxanthini]